MPRLPDIKAAFHAAIQRNPKGYLCLHTDDFIHELGILNWHFSRKDANEWIARYQNDFADKTPEQSDNRYWILRNMGRIF
ncbi:hypothetical protein D3C78_1107920 [compost metagenome]